MEVFFEQEEAAESMERRLLVTGSAARDSSTARTDRRRVSARTDTTGNFKISILYVTKFVGEELLFVVSGPAGQLIGDASYKVDDITGNNLNLEISVSTKDIAPILLEVPTNLPKAATRRITGRVLDRAGKSVPANLQVLLFARKDTGPDGTDTPVLVARTDCSGYFFGDAPNEIYERAAALVAGIATEIAIALDDGFIPTRLALLVDVPPTADPQPKVDDCSRDATPRTPSHADIESAPDTYSTDLGTGRCVQFNTPNRAIEEFDFYTVVRTTEPDIVGFTSGGQTPVSTVGSDGALAALTTALATAEAVAAAANQMATAAELNASAAETAADETRKLKVAFEAAYNSAAWQDVSTMVFDRANGGSLKSTTLTDFLVSLRMSVDLAGKVARSLVEAVQGYTPEQLKLQLPNRDDLARRIVSQAAEAARAADRIAAAQASSTAGAAAAANLKEAEATRTKEAARLALEAKKADLAAQAELQARKAQTKPVGRAHLNAKNPIDWDETPTFYQAAEIAHGHLLHFKQVWSADGYSLGDLLFSLPLAPGQKKLISVVDWERRERTGRAEDTVSSEGVNATLSRDRDLGEVVTGALSESSRGGSKSTSAGVGSGTGAAGNGSYQGFNFGALLGASGGYGESNSSAWQDSARNLSSSSLQNLRDRTLQSASAVRSLRSCAVHTVSQGEAVRATTEVVANHNHCHAVTIQYFEVLRHLKLQHELADVQECLFVPLPMSEFDLEKALRWRQELRTYLQLPGLAGGFDAARRVQTNWSQVDFPLERYADEFVMSLSGELLIAVLIPLPPFPERPKPTPEDTAAETAQAIADAVNPTTGVLGVILAVATGGVSLAAGAATTATINAAQAAATGARSLADELYAETPQERYGKFHRDIVPGVVEGFIDQLGLWALVGGNPVRLQDADFTLASEYQPGIPLLVSLRATLDGQWQRSKISQLIIKSEKGLPPTFRAIVNSATIRYRTNTFEHSFVNDRRVNDDIDPPKAVAVFSNLTDYEIKTFGTGKGAALFTPIDSWEQRSPRTEDRRLAAELIEHLNDNFEYYHHAIWWAMDPNRRYMLLDGYYAPGSNNRSVASVVENRLIGIVGNSVVLPVARGIHLDPRFSPDKEGNSADLMDFYRLETPVPAARVSLPTRGIFAEAVMGSCNSCEEIDDSRFWRWEESPIDEPPSIDPISTATRRSEAGPVQPSPFPSPIVSIQNSPSAPDPAGVRVALDALGKQSFADITGLAGTQANAAAAYQQALDTAFKFGKEASTLAQQAAMLKSLDKTMGAIDKAEAGGKIDADKAKDLRTTALKKMVGDSDSAGADASDIQKRLDIISGAVKGDSISPDDGQGHSNAVLKNLYGDSASSDGASAIGDIMKRVTPESASRLKASAPDGSSLEVEQALAGADQILGQKRTTPASKTGMSGLSTSSGRTTSLVQSALDGSKQWIDAVGNGLAAWKDDPNKELSDALTDAVLAAAKTAAEKVTDEIPIIKAMKVAATYAVAFADGIGDELTKATTRLSARYERDIQNDPGSDGYTDEDIRALQDIRSYQLHAVTALPDILRGGVERVVEKALGELANWVVGTVSKKFVGVSKSLLAHLIEKSPLKALVSGALDAAGAAVPDAREKVYRAALSSTISLFVRQLGDARLRASLSGFTKLGGKEPLDKAILVAIASCLVDAGSQEPQIKKFFEGLNKDTRAWLTQYLNELVDSLAAKGVQIVSTNKARPSVTGATEDTVEIPDRLLAEIQSGLAAVEDADYRKWLQISDVMEELRKATERRLTLLSKVRQPRLVYLNDYGLAEIDAPANTPLPYETAYEKYRKEYTDACQAVRNLYSQLAGGNLTTNIWLLTTVIRFEAIDVQFPKVREMRTYDIVSGTFSHQRLPSGTIEI